MILRGNAWIFGDNIDTDVIIPVKYTNTNDPQEFGRHCMEGIDPDFPRKIKPGDIIVAKKNFGCGSSREPAPISIKAIGISCIIAKTFARIFYRNAFNVGLPLLECEEAPEQIDVGHDLEVNLDTGEIKNLSSAASFKAKPIPPFMQDLIRDGGLMNHIAKTLKPKES
jgi:3-isopropylmalate/(R)-2-methylmalate dehydratase small subunit